MVLQMAYYRVSTDGAAGHPDRAEDGLLQGEPSIDRSSMLLVALALLLIALELLSTRFCPPN